MLSIREAEASDEPFLREMLYHSLYVTDGDRPFDLDVVAQPEIAKYVDAWGRPGDLGLIAVDSTSGEAIGAIWMRLFSATDRGFGFLHSTIPELGVAVLPDRRGCGVGSVLLQRLLEMGSELHAAVSLSVSVDNPALRLYQRFGFERVEAHGDSVTMLKHLK